MFNFFCLSAQGGRGGGLWLHMHLWADSSQSILFKNNKISIPLEVAGQGQQGTGSFGEDQDTKDYSDFNFRVMSALEEFSQGRPREFETPPGSAHELVENFMVPIGLGSQGKAFCVVCR